MFSTVRRLIGALFNKFGYLIIKDKSAEFYRYLNPSDEIIILDIGSYHGDFSLEMNSLFKKAKIFAFEPQKAEFDILVQNVKNKPIFPQNVAISNESGKIKMFKTSGAPSSSLLKSNELYFPEQKVIGSEEVDTIILTDWLKISTINQVDILKIDIQGLELKLLENIKSILPKVKMIFIELNFKEQYIDSSNFWSVFKFLGENDFDLINIYNLSQFKGRLMFCDGLFVNKQFLEK